MRKNEAVINKNWKEIQHYSFDRSEVHVEAQVI